MNIEITMAGCIGYERCYSVHPDSLICLGADKGVDIPHPEWYWECASYVKECSM